MYRFSGTGGLTPGTKFLLGNVPLKRDRGCTYLAHAGVENVFLEDLNMYLLILIKFDPELVP
jgi:hypothetical protein